MKTPLPVDTLVRSSEALFQWEGRVIYYDLRAANGAILYLVKITKPDLPAGYRIGDTGRWWEEQLQPVPPLEQLARVSSP